jgi:hypothetical protein
VQAVLREVDALRKRYIEDILIECGLPHGEVSARAELAYALLRTSDATRSDALLSGCEALLALSKEGG